MSLTPIFANESRTIANSRSMPETLVGRDHVVGHRVRVGARRLPDAVRAALVAELVEHRVGEREVVLLGLQLGVHVGRRDRRQERRRAASACPRKTTSMICLRSNACESAARSFGSSSSRFFFFFGFELKPKSRTSVPWPVTTWMSPDLPSWSATVERHLVDVVDVVALERGEHRVGVREPGDADGVDVRLACRRSRGCARGSSCPSCRTS